MAAHSLCGHIFLLILSLAYLRMNDILDAEADVEVVLVKGKVLETGGREPWGTRLRASKTSKLAVNDLWDL